MTNVLKFMLWQAFTSALMIAGWCFETEWAKTAISVQLFLGLILAIFANSEAGVVKLQIDRKTLKNGVGLWVFILKLAFFVWFSELFLASQYLIFFLIGPAAERAKQFEQKAVA